MSIARIPGDGYWRIAGQVFSFPLVTVFAASWAEARAIASEGGVNPYDGWQAIDLAADSTEAQLRLGTWARPDLAAAMRRGDVP